MRSQKTINERQSIKLGLIAGCGKDLVLRIPCGVCRWATLHCLLVIQPYARSGEDVKDSQSSQILPGKEKD
jgi:hypothetical protein